MKSSKNALGLLEIYIYKYMIAMSVLYQTARDRNLWIDWIKVINKLQAVFGIKHRVAISPKLREITKEKEIKCLSLKYISQQFYSW